MLLPSKFIGKENFLRSGASWELCGDWRRLVLPLADSQETLFEALLSGEQSEEHKMLINDKKHLDRIEKYSRKPKLEVFLFRSSPAP